MQSLSSLPFISDDVSKGHTSQSLTDLKRSHYAAEPVVLYTCETISLPLAKSLLPVYAKSKPDVIRRRRVRKSVFGHQALCYQLPMVFNSCQLRFKFRTICLWARSSGLHKRSMMTSATASIRLLAAAWWWIGARYSPWKDSFIDAVRLVPTLFTQWHCWLAYVNRGITMPESILKHFRTNVL